MLKSLGSKDVEFKLPKSPGVTMSSKDLNKLKELSEKVPALEDALKKLTERVDVTEDRLDAHDTNISDIWKALNEKADKSVKEELNNLKHSLNDLHNQIDKFGSLRADIEANKKRCEAIEQTITSLEDRIDNLRNSLNERLRDLEGILMSLKEELEKLDTENNRQGGMIIHINQRIDTLELRISTLDKSMSGNLLGNNFSTDQPPDVSDLKRQFESFKRDFISFKEEHYKRNKEVEEELNKKVDKADLIEFERLMRDRMEAMDKALQKAKSELKKALRILDDRVKRLTDQVKSRGPSLDREDAMLSKKPLEGFKCATCDKNLVNMIGLPVEHYNWNRMPKKEGERIPMMGQGFSRMLMTLNHNASTSNLDNRTSRTFYSPREEEDVINESSHSSRNDNQRASASRVEKDGSTTVEASILPQIKKKKKVGK